MFVYGPKADPYHAGKWREDYPSTLTDQQRYMGLITQDDLRSLAAKAKACNVDFVMVYSSALEGGGINFSNLDPGIEDIIHKFDALYKLGIRHFGVSIDDMNAIRTINRNWQIRLRQNYMRNSTKPESLKMTKWGLYYLFLPNMH